MTATPLRRLAVLTSIALATAAAGCGSSGEPEVGKCTNADPELTVQVVDLKVVDCGDGEATQRIVKEVKDGSECEQARLTFENRTFCTEALKGGS